MGVDAPWQLAQLVVDTISTTPGYLLCLVFLGLVSLGIFTVRTPTDR
jgi:hypothetical protein